MTALITPARPEHDAGPRPVPWPRMIWVTWRQHRAALAGVAILLGALAVYLWLDGLQIHHAYATDCHPGTSLACSINFSGRYGTTGILVSVFLQAVPVLIGEFAGAPLLARELENGTYRFAWTQGIGRWRWTLAKLVLLAVVVTAVAGAFSVLYSWYNQPFFAAGYAIPFSTRVFGLGEVAFAAWTLAAFSIGALAGMLIRRGAPAIAATLAVYAGLAVAAAGFLREHYLTPVTTSSANVPGTGWIISQWWTKDGRFSFAGSPPMTLINQFCSSLPAGQGKPSQGTFAQCLAQHGYTMWTSYQPASRFWPFQWIEGGCLLALSALLIAATLLLGPRRAGWLTRRT